MEAFVLEENNDAIGLDPQAVFTARRDGEYMVRVFSFPAEGDANIGLSGGDNFVYRLTVTTGGWIDYALPLAVRVQEPTEVQLRGINLPESLAPRTIAPSEGLWRWMPIAVGHADLAGHATVVATKHALVVGNAESVERIELPAVVSGVIAEPRERHVFSFAAMQGQNVRVGCEARSLGFPLQARLTVTDEQGKVLAKGVPAAPRTDPSLVFTPPADGTYRLIVADEPGRGGPRFAYRVTVEPVRPDFALSLATDTFAVPAGGSTEIAVAIDRRDGFAEPIEIAVVGLPAGVVAEPITSPPEGEAAKSVKIVLKRAAESATAFGPVQVVGRGAAIERVASFPTNLPLAPPHVQAWVAAP